MPQETQSSSTSPMRIVPMVRPAPALIEEALAAAPQAVQPQLTYNGGPLIANVQVFTLFWGSAWSQPDLAALSSQLNQFFQYIVTSPLIDQLAEYSVDAYPIGPGLFAGSFTLTDQDPPSQVTDQQIQDLLQAQTAGGGNLPAPGPNLLYFVFTPPGVTVDLSGDLSCSAFCGYHSAVGSSLFYAAMPYPDCSGCQVGSTDLDSLTVTASHELSEAITDPIPGQGWYWYSDPNNQGEIGDICVGQTKTLGSYTIQTEWSNAAGQCE